MDSLPQRIDVHHHILPPEHEKAAARYGVADGGGIPFPAWRRRKARLPT